MWFNNIRTRFFCVHFLRGKRIGHGCSLELTVLNWTPFNIHRFTILQSLSGHSFVCFISLKWKERNGSQNRLIRTRFAYSIWIFQIWIFPYSTAPLQKYSDPTWPRKKTLQTCPALYRLFLHMILHLIYLFEFLHIWKFIEYFDLRFCVYY